MDGAAFSDMGYEYNTAMSGNPLIFLERHAVASNSTLPADLSFFISFHPVSGCCGCKMGADSRAANSTVVDSLTREIRTEAW